MIAWRFLVWSSLLALAAGHAHAQTKPADPLRASAIKLPDGTVVFITKNPDDPNPVIDGVVLSAAEYQALADQADTLKAQKEAAKPTSPSAVAIRGAIEVRGERTVAVLTAVYSFRTTKPKTVVALGGQRAAVVSAHEGTGATGKLPVLAATEDGFTVLAESAGEHTLTLKLEVPVSSRGVRGETGFDLGLPRAAISTFTLDTPPVGVKAMSVGTRTTDQLTTRRAAVSAEQLAAKPLPLGPTDTLELTWEPGGGAGGKRTVESEVSVRVDEVQIDTVAKLRLRGPGGDWPLGLPPSAEVNVERVGGSLVPQSSTATVVKPGEPNRLTWTVRTPATTDDTEWLVTVTTRQPRPKPTDARFRGPYPIGPYFVPAAKHTGKLKVYAPPTVQVGFKPSADLRRQDPTPTADDDPVAVFAYTGTATQATAWADLDARPAVNTVRVRPHHKLRLTPAGWRLETVVRVVPPARIEVEQLTVELPPGWTDLDVTPADLIDLSAVSKDTAARSVGLRRLIPQKAAFEFTLTATFPVPMNSRDATLPLPRIAQAEERDTKLTATVPDGLEVTATSFGWEQGQPAAAGEPLKASGRAVSGEFDRGLSKVTLAWQTHRPELGYEGRVEVTVLDRQLSIAQVLKFQPGEGDTRPVRLRGPADLIGLSAKPRLEPIGRDEWEFKPAAEPGKEFTLTVQFAVKIPPRTDPAAPVSVPLLWPVAATSTAVTARVWGGGGCRAEAVVGRWREGSPEPSADRDSLPWFTLTAAGEEPLALVLAATDGTNAPSVLVERALVQAVLADDSTAAVRGRFVLLRWPGSGVDLELPPGASADVFVDGKRVDPLPRPDGVRVPVPDPKPGRATCVLDVRLQTPVTGGWGGRALIPPRVRAAAYRSPVRWSVACGGGSVLLLPSTGVQTEARWAWRGYGFGPTAVESPADFERRLRDGSETDVTEQQPATAAGGEVVTARQTTLGPFAVTLVPRLAWVAGASFVSFVLVLGLSRLRRPTVGPAMVLSALAVAALAVLTPHSAAQFTAAAQPGVLLAVLVILGMAASDWHQRRKVDRLPAFSRPASVTPSAPAPANRPSRSATPAPVESSATAGS